MKIKKITKKLKSSKGKLKEGKLREDFWKKFFRILTIEFASLSILEVLLIMLIVGGGIFYIKNIFQKSYEERLTEKISGLKKCQKDLKRQAEEYAYDKVRIADATNILLALQDYNFDTGNLPESLEGLKQKNYLDGNLSDPEFGKPYYYKKLSPEDYVLCIYLSTGVWGTNVKECPNKEEFLASFNKEVKKEQIGKSSKEEKTVIISQTTTGWLRVREEPSLGARVLIKVYPGEEYKVLEEKDKWIKIEFKNPVKFGGEVFNSGWVWREYVKIK